MVTEVRKPKEERKYDEVRKVQYCCWNDECRRGWTAPFPDPKNPQYLCPHCGSHKTTFKP